MIFFLYHKTTRPTGRVLAKALMFRKFGIRVPNEPLDLLIRWGNSAPSQAAIEINTAEAIRLAADKLAAFRKMSEHGIPVPEFSTMREDIRGTCFGRTRRGSKGRGIAIYQPGEGLNTPHELFTRYIKSTREFRLHVVMGRVVRVQGKYLDFPGNPLATYIKNHENGYRFRQPRQALRQDRMQCAVDAVAALGLDFGAVDMILDEEGKHYVLEVNTGPACSPLTASAYVAAFAPMIADMTEGRYEIDPEYQHLDGLMADAGDPAIAMAGR